MQEAEATQPSALANYLLRRWAWGYLSLPEVQRLASLAKQDAEAAGLKPGNGLLSQLSGLGGDSHLSHNMLRTQTLNCRVELYRISSACSCMHTVHAQVSSDHETAAAVEVPTGSSQATS